MDPFSQKLTSVLSSSYSDADIANSLQLLDSKLANNSNTPDFRRKLRADVQVDVIRSNASIVREFSKVAEQLRRIRATLSVMNRVCEDMRHHITVASTEISPILEEADALILQKQQVETKNRLLNTFKEHFNIPEEEVNILTNSAEPVDDKFFQILTKVKSVHADCEVLLANENQRAGMEIMEQMTRNLHAAFQKLYRWIQREFKNLSLENYQVNTGIRRALWALAERPTLFQSCLDYFSEARQKLLLQSFFDAMTGSEEEIAAGTAKPIELYAHDPLRYIGDILAWLHSATVSEQEALEALFISGGDEASIAKNIDDGVAHLIDDGLVDVPWDEGFDAKKSLTALVDKNLEAVCKQVKARIEQAIASHEESTLAFKISNLINFYRLTFEKIQGHGSHVLETLKGIEEFAMRQFEHNLRDHVRQVQADLPQAPSDLSVPEFLQDALKELRQLMLSYDSSLVPPPAKEVEFRSILKEALDPYLKGCDSLAEDLSKSTRDIFILNCLLMSKATLEQFSFTKERQIQLQQDIEERTSVLIQFLHEYFIDRSGLRPLLVALSEWDRKTPLQQFPEFSPNSLLEVSQQLDHFLPSAIIDGQARLSRLANPKLAASIVHEAAEKLINEFAMVEDAITGENGIDNAHVYWPRVASEVRVLLS